MVKYKKPTPKALTEGDYLWATRINIFTGKRNVWSHFCDLESVALEGSENGKVQKVSPEGID